MAPHAAAPAPTFLPPGNLPRPAQALHNEARVASLLLEAGADVDLRAPNTREPPLVVAACYGHVDVIRVLLQHGRWVRRGGWQALANALAAVVPIWLTAVHSVC